MREAFYIITFLLLSLEVNAQNTDSISIRIFKSPSKNWASLNNTFSYQRTNEAIEFAFKQQKHRILLGDTIVLDSCVYFKSIINPKDSSLEIELLSTCHNYIQTSPQIFDRIFGLIPRLSDIQIPDLYLGSNNLSMVKVSENQTAYLKTNGDTILLQQIIKKERLQLVSTWEYPNLIKDKLSLYSIYFDRNDRIKKITLDNFRLSKPKEWKVNYKKDRISIRTNYYLEKTLQFQIEVPEQISFTELLLNKHNLFFWEIIPFHQNLEFWIMPFLEPQI